MTRLNKWLYWQLIGLLSIIVLGVVFQGQILSFLSHETTSNYLKVSAQDISKNKSQKASYDFEKVTQISAQDYLKVDNSSHKNVAIGIISVPEVNITLPIFLGVGDNNMLYGAGTLKDNQAMGQGNYAIASHHVTGYFGYDASQLLFTPLEKVKEGQKIYITDKVKVFEYEITSTQITDTLRMSTIENQDGKKQITLITCQGYNTPNRIVVKGNLVSEIKYDKETKVLFK